MKQTLVVVADLGRFKAFRLVKGMVDSRAHLELLAESRHEELRQRLSEQVTDGAGRFPKGAGPQNVSGDMSFGERHNIRLEQQRRAVESIADELKALLRGGEFDACWLAVSQPIQQQLLAEMECRTKAKLEKILGADLTKAKTPEILPHFESGK